MNKTDLKQIEEVLDKKLDQKLKPIKKRLDSHDQQFKRINQKLDAHSESLVIIEKDVKILPDVLKLFKEHSVKLTDHEERIQKLEKPRTILE